MMFAASGVVVGVGNSMRPKTRSRLPLPAPGALEAVATVISLQLRLKASTRSMLLKMLPAARLACMYVCE